MWQTRRLGGLKIINEKPDKWIYRGIPYGIAQFISKEGEHITILPCYQVGDIVYIKEAWRVGAWDDNIPTIAVDYKADNYSRKEWLHLPEKYDFEKLWIECSEEAQKAGKEYDSEGQYHWKPGESPCRWRSPMFMPEWVARYFIKITDVRVERLNQITETENKWGWRIEFKKVEKPE